MNYKTIKVLEPDNQYTTIKQIVKISCENCGYDRGLLSYSSYSNTGAIFCNNPNCESKIEQL